MCGLYVWSIVYGHRYTNVRLKECDVNLPTIWQNIIKIYSMTDKRKFKVFS